MTDPTDQTDAGPTRQDGRSTRRRLAAALSENAWLAPALLVGAAVYAAYLLTHPYPAFGAGLFLYMAEVISRNGYALPATIPHYTADGIPFAYPPLAFYLVAALGDLTGVDPIAFSRYLPGLFSLLYLVPFYLFGAALLGSKRQAGLAAMIAAASPPILRWHVSAGGFVRSLAVLFALTGLWTGLHLFRGRDRDRDRGRGGGRRWLVASAALFGLTVLTHPLYTAFFGLSYLWLYAYFDRSVAGLLRGAAVAVGGALVASPWWLSVVSIHGVGAFSGAAGTHGGIGTQLASVLTGPGAFDPTALSSLVPVAVFDFGSTDAAVASTLFLLFALAAVVLGWRGRFFLPVWFVLVAVFLGKPRLPFFAGALMAGAAFGVAVDRLRAGADGADAGAEIDRERRATLAAFGAVGVGGTALGTAYAGRRYRTHGGDTASLPPFIDDADVAAMRWAAANVPPSATFVVLGDAAEWFPYLTERTILIGPWGVEWRGREEYRRQLTAFREVSACETADCVTEHLRSFGVSPDYLYVPKGRYTVRGGMLTTPPSMRRTLVASDRYRLVHENGGAMIFRVVRSSSGPSELRRPLVFDHRSPHSY